MEFEKAKEILENEVANICDEELSEALEVVLNNSIPVKKAKSKIKEAINLIEQEQFKTIMGDTTICNRIKWILEKELLEEDK